jgi:hypothetical protein
LGFINIIVLEHLHRRPDIILGAGVVFGFIPARPKKRLRGFENNKSAGNPVLAQALASHGTSVFAGGAALAAREEVMVRVGNDGAS